MVGSELVGHWAGEEFYHEAYRQMSERIYRLMLTVLGMRASHDSLDLKGSVRARIVGFGNYHPDPDTVLRGAQLFRG